jgi:hypothetical protein
MAVTGGWQKWSKTVWFPRLKPTGPALDHPDPAIEQVSPAGGFLPFTMTRTRGLIENGLKYDSGFGLGKVGTLVGALLNKTGFQVVGAARSQRADLPFKTVTF